MGQEQLVQTIQLIIEDFYYFNIEDFKLCFNNAKRGRYGKVYDRLDGNVIYEWLETYSKERVQFAYPESNLRPIVSGKEERMTGKDDKDFKKFKLEYIAKKALNHGSN